MAKYIFLLLIMTVSCPVCSQNRINKGIVVDETTTSIRFYWGNEKYTKPIPWEKFKKAMSIINSK